jgi:uncharacterized protein (TIGR02246 family)
MSLTKSLIAAALAAGLAACAGRDAAPDPAAGIAESAAAFEAAFNGRDAQGVAALYTADAVVIPPGAPRAVGRGEIGTLWQSYIDNGVSDLDLVTTALDEQGDTATELGRFTLTAPDGSGGRVTAEGRYMVLWKLEPDGVWRLKWDGWNNAPAG